MILQLILLLFLLTIIFFVSKNIVNQIYFVIANIFKNKKAAVWVLAILFLPGTVVHELAHLLTALVLRVPTGPMSIWPSFENIRGDSPLRGQSPTDSGQAIRVRIGHIMVAKTSAFKMTLIGVAPMTVGLIIIYLVGEMIFNIGDSPRSGTVPLIYLLFVVSTSMFSSRQDLKSLLITLPVITLIISALYLSGIKITIEENLSEFVGRVLGNLNRSLILTAVIDYMVLVLFTVFRKLS